MQNLTLSKECVKNIKLKKEISTQSKGRNSFVFFLSRDTMNEVMKLKLLKECLPYIIILIVVLLLRTFIVTPIKVHGLSMYDTLQGDEIMILWKLGEVKRYDIVVADIEVSGEEDVVIKRVFGLPGETISCENGKLYINGSLIEDNYGYGETSDFEPVTLKENEYFLLGDNREISLDSRVFGTVNQKDIEGTTNFIIWPFKEFGTVEN